MPVYNGDRLLETFTTEGTGNITVLGAESSHRTLASILTANGDTGDFVLAGGAQWESCRLTRVSATVYSRGTPYSSSTGAAISFNPGTKEVWGDVPSALLYSMPGYGGDFALISGKLAVSAAAGALTIAVKTNNGNDPTAAEPVFVVFRDAAAATGGFAVMAIVAANSLVISSGSTLGVASGTAFRLWIVGFNDGGTFRLGAIKCRATNIIYPLVEGLESATAEGVAGAADSSGVIYAGATVSAKPMRILGFIEWDSVGLTAGTWTVSTLLQIQPFGPGIKKPNDNVRTIVLDTNTLSGTTSTTVAASALSQAIALKSAANAVRYNCIGVGGADTNGDYIVPQMYIDASALSQTSQVYSTTGGVMRIPFGLAGMAFPNTLSSVTFAVKFGAVAAGRNVTCGQGTLILDEVMT